MKFEMVYSYRNVIFSCLVAEHIKHVTVSIVYGRLQPIKTQSFLLVAAKRSYKHYKHFEKKRLSPAFL
jgi:hypothetical protein